MNVKMMKNYKEYLTIHQADQARQIIKSEKENGWTAKDAAEYAIREALKDTGDYLREILTASAEINMNCRAWDLYGEGTGSLDVWIEATAKTAEGFIEIGAYLSDIWQTGAVAYKHNMYIQRYTRA